MLRNAEILTLLACVLSTLQQHIKMSHKYNIILQHLPYRLYSTFTYFPFRLKDTGDVHLSEM